MLVLLSVVILVVREEEGVGMGSVVKKNWVKFVSSHVNNRVLLQCVFHT